MPLIQGKSNASRSKNIGTEISAGKPAKQAEAIAYSVQRKAKAKKMAEGGLVEEIDDMDELDDLQEPEDDRSFYAEESDNPAVKRKATLKKVMGRIFSARMTKKDED